MAKLTGEEREIILNALKEVGLGRKELKGAATLNDRRLVAFAEEFIANSDEDEDDDEEIDDEDLDDEEVDSDEESEDDDEEEEVTGNSEDEDDSGDEDDSEEDFEEEELVDNEDFEDFEDEEAVHNGCGSGKKKKGKKGATMNRRELTAQEWMDSAPPEIAEVVNNALAHSRDQKAALIEKLTANLSGEKRKEMIRKLANNSLAQLQDIASLSPSAQAAKPQARVPRQVVHIGAGGVTTNSKKEKDMSEPLIPPTINFAELSKEFGK